MAADPLRTTPGGTGMVSNLRQHAVSITLDTYSHAIPAMQAEAAALIAGPVFAGKQNR